MIANAHIRDFVIRRSGVIELINSYVHTYACDIHIFTICTYVGQLMCSMWVKSLDGIGDHFVSSSNNM